jgi:alpha-methylacyl-CoA racemase
MGEVGDDPHLRARSTYVERDGVLQPSPAPRFSRTPSALDRPPAPPGFHTREVLRERGFSEAELDALLACGAVA